MKSCRFGLTKTYYTLLFTRHIWHLDADSWNFFCSNTESGIESLPKNELFSLLFDLALASDKSIFRNIIDEYRSVWSMSNNKFIAYVLLYVQI